MMSQKFKSILFLFMLSFSSKILCESEAIPKNLGIERFNNIEDYTPDQIDSLLTEKNFTNTVNSIYENINKKVLTLLDQYVASEKYAPSILFTIFFVTYSQLVYSFRTASSSLLNYDCGFNNPNGYRRLILKRVISKNIHLTLDLSICLANILILSSKEESCFISYFSRMIDFHLSNEVVMSSDFMGVGEFLDNIEKNNWWHLYVEKFNKDDKLNEIHDKFLKEFIFKMAKKLG